MMARMAKFTESFFYTDTDGYTVPAASATVTVYDVDTVSSKTIYSSESGAAQANPAPAGTPARRDRNAGPAASPLRVDPVRWPSPYSGPRRRQPGDGR